LAQERVLLAAADASSIEDYGRVAQLIETAPASVQVDTLTSLLNANANAFVYFAQKEMKKRGVYSGAPNGLLTSSTIKSINRLCSESVAADRCKQGPLHYQAARVISILLDPYREPN
jgi:hypothetical protein